MEVTGYQLRAALQRWQERRDTAAARFADSLHAFKDEVKTSPAELSEEFLKADDALAVLRTAQAHYNQVVSLPEGYAEGKSYLSLAVAVKLVGGLGKMAAMWRAASIPDRHNRATSRSTEAEHAKPTVSVAECIAKADALTRRKSSLAAGIAQANTSRVEISALTPALFDA